MREVGNLKRIGEQFSAQGSGLVIATTSQARYVLPPACGVLRKPSQRLTSACTVPDPSRAYH
jgi:hypothetical protein